MIQTLDAIVNPFGDLESESPDNVQRLDSHDNVLERTLRNYEKFISKGYVANEDLKDLKISSFEPLSPLQINVFTHKMLHSYPLYRENTYFLSKLIQDSYNAGNNDFLLDLRCDNWLIAFCLNLNGTKENPLKLRAIGNPGSSFAHSSKNCIFELDKGEWYTGKEAEDCTFNINGDVNEYCGVESVRSVFNIKGDAGSFCGKESEECEYNILGDVDNLIGARSKDCTYAIAGEVHAGLGTYSKRCKYIVGGQVSFGYAEGASNCTFVFAGDALRTDALMGPGNTFIVYTPKVYEKLKRKYATVILKK